MYQVVISNKAEKALRKLPGAVYTRMVAALRSLAQEPRPSGCKKLKSRDAWRIRVGAYRAIYEIEDNQLLVLIISIGHRKDIYDD